MPHDLGSAKSPLGRRADYSRMNSRMEYGVQRYVTWVTRSGNQATIWQAGDLLVGPSQCSSGPPVRV